MKGLILLGLWGHQALKGLLVRRVFRGLRLRLKSEDQMMQNTLLSQLKFTPI